MDRAKAINFRELISCHEFHLSLSDILEDRESESSKASYKCSLLLRGCFCAVLEDIKCQLQCLNGFSNKMKTLDSNINLPDSLEELKNLKQKGKEYIIIYAKLDADRKYVYKVIKKTFLELIEHNTFFCLKENIYRIVSLENYRYDLLIDKEKNKITRRNFIKQLRIQRNHIKAQLYDTNVVIENLKIDIDDAQPMNEVKRRYTENWQLARMEQHKIITAKKENIPRSSISNFKEKYGQEVVVHSEVQRLIRIQINQTLSKIEVLMNKYDKDLENIELQIQINKNVYYDIRDKRMEMEEMLVDRESLIKNWTKFKEEREIARLYEEKMTNAAYTIQAWWRGLLVRLKLGPFAEKIVKKKKKRK